MLAMKDFLGLFVFKPLHKFVITCPVGLKKILLFVLSALRVTGNCINKHRIGQGSDGPYIQNQSEFLRQILIILV
jgi:hypothetical protein